MLLYKAISYFVLYNLIQFCLVYFTTEYTNLSHIKKEILINPYIFESVIIDEGNNVANFFLNITDSNYSNYNNSYITNYEIGITKQRDFIEVLQTEIYSSTEEIYQNIKIFYNSKKSMISWLIDFIIIGCALYFLTHVIKKIANQEDILEHPMLNTQNSSFVVKKNINVTFKDVIGLESVKEDLKEYVGYIENREKYLKDGCKIPRGLMMVGSPGTGKTLLAKALAGESNASFIPVSGSDFIEVYVGIGSQRVRKLFNLARQHAPSIIFIDEIDTIGRKRSGSSVGGHSEHGSTLNKLLTEMDGFTENENILVLAATNMIETLDPALTRSGRFDRKIIFDKPNRDERKKLFELYLGKVNVGQKFKDNMENNLNELSTMSAGLTGADIANIVNQGTMRYVKRKNPVILKSDNQNNDNQNNDNIEELDSGLIYDDILKAIDEVMVGMEKKERTMTKTEKITVSYHEAGHCLISYLLKQASPPVKTSIIPRGEAALGFSQPEPEDKKLYNREELFARLCVLYAGRGAEEIKFNCITTGASDDIDKATKLVYSMVNVYGMTNKIGLINTTVSESEFKGIVSDSTKATVDKLVNKIVTDAYKITKELIINHKNDLETIAQFLLEKEVMTKFDMDDVFKEKNIKNSIDINDFMDFSI